MVTKLDRVARSLPDARAIADEPTSRRADEPTSRRADELTFRQISLTLGGLVYDPTDAVGRLLFNALSSQVLDQRAWKSHLDRQ